MYILIIFFVLYNFLVGYFVKVTFELGWIVQFVGILGASLIILVMGSDTENILPFSVGIFVYQLIRYFREKKKREDELNLYRRIFRMRKELFKIDGIMVNEYHDAIERLKGIEDSENYIEDKKSRYETYKKASDGLMTIELPYHIKSYEL